MNGLGEAFKRGIKYNDIRDSSRKVCTNSSQVLATVIELIAIKVNITLRTIEGAIPSNEVLVEDAVNSSQLFYGKVLEAWRKTSFDLILDVLSYCRLG